MNKLRLAATVAVVLITNGVLLGLAAHNRSGTPEATIELTERELRLTPGSDENTGMSLTLDWRAPQELRALAGEDTDTAWFDRSKLEELGYNCRLPLTDPQAERYYETMTTQIRPAYAVVELGGDKWEQRVSREIAWADETRRDELKGSGSAVPEMRRVATRVPTADEIRRRRSRLLVVDVGPSVQQLRSRYPDRTRYLIARATVSLRLDRTRPDGTPARLSGIIAELLPSSINVPREQRAVLDALPRTPDAADRPGMLMLHDPRYRVTIAYGRRLEPWLVKIEKAAQ